MFFAHGDKWRIVRQNLTPLFSSARMKSMFHLIQKCAYMFEDMMDYETRMSNVIGAKTLMTRYTMDCICSCAFGVEANTQARNAEKNPFTIIGQIVFTSSYCEAMRIIGRTLWPKIFYGLGFKWFPSELDNFFFKLMTGVFESRNYKPSPRNDFVDLLLNLKNNEKNIIGDSMSNLKTGGSKKVELEVTNELLVSQCVVFFSAGFETSASALGLTLYELAKNQDAQRRAQKEVDKYLERHGNKLTYDCVKELPYINACVAETTRLYPVFGFLTREVVEDYTFPSGLQLGRGARVHLPVYYLHHNADHFPEPESYKPERFLPGAEHEIKPFTFFPFGEGPRYCIVTLLYYVTTKTFNYWEKKKVPYAKPVPFFGNYAGHIQMRKSSGKISQKLCEKFRDEPFFGTFYGTDPALVILDPEVIKLVFTKDFYYFSSREGMDYNHREITT
ncbi:Cytochrome CYP6AE49 [Operophtera brumata]|uniref:unspecific monooxygenase n=1 Tax=Operophtera brumata TaxID=104452 RepID=A0A0L7LJF1_OPEBR|nr:Cytochrome CYP6AE49 [Operophtera brumata]